jgi:hypothetical protein
MGADVPLTWTLSGALGLRRGAFGGVVVIVQEMRRRHGPALQFLWWHRREYDFIQFRWRRARRPDIVHLHSYRPDLIPGWFKI